MVRVVIADDHAIVRQGLIHILSNVSGINVTGEAVDGQQALEQIRSQPCDVLVLDLSMPGRSGFDILRELKHEHPELPVLVLSIHSEEQFAVRILKAGASGYLTKESAPDELVQAIRKVAGGGKYISPNLAEALAFELEDGSSGPPHESLSDREFQVMRMMALGKTATEIAEELSLSVKTISTYRARILEKMNLKNNSEIIRYAIDNHLIS
jgi:two-component system, NarL family, invasion response regulator UvrY